MDTSGPTDHSAVIRMVTIAVSDVHLGHTQQKDNFKSFLDHLGKRSATRLTIVGDFLDMWRRDIAGVVIENADVLTQLERLKTQGMKIFMIAGNHDYHIRILKDKGYQFKFYESGSPKADLLIDGKVCSFYHGYEFSDLQIEAFFEPLCNTTDDQGEHLSDFWDDLQSVSARLVRVLKWLYHQKGPKAGQEFYPKGVRIGHERARKKYEAMLASPEERLKEKFSQVRRTALYVKKKKAKHIVVYGHTHEPFVDESQTLANTGSWVKSEKYPYNTFLEISEHGIVLKRWIEGEEKVIRRPFSTNQIETKDELW